MARKFDLKKVRTFSISKRDELSQLSKFELNWKSGVRILDASAFLWNDAARLPEDADFVYYKTNFPF